MPRVLLSSTNEEYEVSDEAAALSCTLRNAAEDVADGLPMPTPLTNETLTRACETLTRACEFLNTVASANLLDGVADAAALRENGIKPHDDDDLKERAAGVVAHLNLHQIAQRLLDLKLRDCPLPASILMVRAAALMRNQDATALRTRLRAPDDLSAEDKASALREPLFTPAPPVSGAAVDVQPPSIGYSVSFAMDDSQNRKLWGCLTENASDSMHLTEEG